ncbi:ATP synthase F1 subunit epsilon [Oceanococcus atlanticus]|uniref:ATP synthase epsilon chain n=1 Tax=Oceanococcus atlanticus TaxID=1317117 RepID=A0A1Y1SBP3_9GAMM|nr:F0F1 ATP synthase subunit epsilon [Oceanococcus atlanticus]ORE85412.1 ATP synthase F1 subunit epsilon [Oceanococcus atlanticus]
MELKVDIVSAEGEIHAGTASMVFAPAEMGEVGIAPRHAPLLTRLNPGVVRVKNGDEEQEFFVSGGLLEVQPYKVTVMADTAQRAHDIDEAAAIEAKKRAEEALSQAGSDIDMARAQAELAEAAARLHLVSKLKTKR